MVCYRGGWTAPEHRWGKGEYDVTNHVVYFTCYECGAEGTCGVNRDYLVEGEE